MNKLMIKTMDEAPDPNGVGGGGGVSPEPAPEAAPAEPAETPAETPEPAPEATPNDDDADLKPTLGAKNGEAPAPKAYEEKDYLEGIKRDEKMFGADSGVEFDAEFVKAMSPVLKELNIAPDAASKLANAMVKAQMAVGAEALKSRRENFKKMNQLAEETFSEDDFALINAGIDANFDPKGVMNFVIRNSELGSDIEFLNVMKKLGMAHRQDSVSGAAAGAGASGADPNSYDGLSKMW